MSGKRITQRQVSLYMSKRQQGHSQVTSAEKADISERSGRRIEKGERTSIPTEHNWRTRQDPLEKVWEKELVPLLEKQGRLTGRLQHSNHTTRSNPKATTLNARIPVN